MTECTIGVAMEDRGMESDFGVGVSDSCASWSNSIKGAINSNNIVNMKRKRKRSPWTLPFLPPRATGHHHLLCLLLCSLLSLGISLPMSGAVDNPGKYSSFKFKT
jgi:hypothetical protein